MSGRYLIRNFSKPFKGFVATFIIMLSVGFYTGLFFVSQTESDNPKGIIENYNGNENITEATVMKFKKGEREMLTIIHTHILAISFIFVFLGLLIWGTEISVFWKSFLTIEPFISLITTFCGIYLIWLGYEWISYIVIFSGFLMTITFLLGTIIVINSMLKPPIS